MIERLHHRGWHHGLLVVLCTLMFFLNLGGATLWDLDEGRNATCAWEMMESGNWIVPTFNSALRDHKPALLYWLQILSYMLFGVNELAARFPSALAALATVLLAYELARSMFGRTTGLLAGVIAATMPMMCGAARFANPDALLNFCTVLTFTIFWLGQAERRWWWFTLLGFAMGLAVLAKGPVGVVLPVGIIVLFLAWERRWRALFDWRWGYMYAAFIFTAIPWYVLVGLETHGEFLKGFLFRHNLERGMATMENHGGFPGYYLVILLAGTMPWSIFLGVAWWFGFWSTVRHPWNRWQAWWARAAEAAEPASLDDKPAAYRLLACWIAVYVLFFSVAATKLPNYVLPVAIPSALLTARFLYRWRREPERMPRWLAGACVACLLLIGIGVALGLALGGGAFDLPRLRGRVFPGLAPWALLGLAPVLAAAACWHFSRARQYGRVITAIAMSAVVLFAPMAAYGTAVFNAYKAPRPLVELTCMVRPGDDFRIGCWQMEHLPSLNFYVQRNVEHLHDEHALASLLQSRLPVYVFIPLGDWQQMESRMSAAVRIIGRHHDMYHHTEILVLTNR